MSCPLSSDKILAAPSLKRLKTRRTSQQGMVSARTLQPTLRGDPAVESRRNNTRGLGRKKGGLERGEEVKGAAAR